MAERQAEDAGSLLLEVAGEHLSLPLAAVAEILRPRPLTRVPLAPPALLGVLNLRGAVLPVLSLARLLGRATNAPGPAARVVVASRPDGSRVGLLVDSVAKASSAAAPAIGLDALLARDFAALRHMARADAADAAPPTRESRRAEADAADLVCFTAAGQEYAWPLTHCVAVMPLPAARASMPGAPAAMLGVIAWRGLSLPLVGLPALLGAPAAPAASARVVVVRHGGALCGLVVDAMRAVLRVPAADIDPIPPVLTRGAAQARIAAICRLEGGRRLVCILAPDGLLDGGVTETAAAPLEETAAGASTDEGTPTVLFTLGGETYGMPAGAVAAIVRRPAVLAPLPRAPAFVLGVMNVRGRVVPVIDQPARFGAQSGAAPSLVMVVSVPGAGGSVVAGLAVNAVHDVRRIPPSSIVPAPDLAEGLIARAATLADGAIALLVDPALLLSAAQRDILAAISAAASAPDGSREKTALADAEAP